MNSTRRKFLSLAAAGSLLGANLLKSAVSEPSVLVLSSPEDSAAPAASISKVENNKPILPKSLRSGSKIAIIAPASPTSVGEITNCVKVFKKLGCTVEIGKTITKRDSNYKYLSASDEERAKEFMEYITRQDIDCIISGRGGYGVMRILPLLDFTAIKENPKIIMGFSDITALINTIYQKSNIVTFHGPVASSGWGQNSVESMKSILFAKEKFVPIKNKFPKIDIITEGLATGKLVGGNLSMVAGTLGTPYEIDTKNSILILEEVSEEPYRIDRLLTQLWLAGKLQQCNAIIFGYFKNLTARRNFWPVISYTVKAIIESRIKSLGIPSVLGLPIGHQENNITLPIGINAELDTKQKSLTILEPSTQF